ncbi:unnamed protein product [Closterium sp. Naga37s-1]|nr:unnamed protein product [Closterium sp. Naga37s-1]
MEITTIRRVLKIPLQEWRWFRPENENESPQRRVSESENESADREVWEQEWGPPELEKMVAWVVGADGHSWLKCYYRCGRFKAKQRCLAKKTADINCHDNEPISPDDIQFAYRNCLHNYPLPIHRLANCHIFPLTRSINIAASHGVTRPALAILETFSANLPATLPATLLTTLPATLPTTLPATLPTNLLDTLPITLPPTLSAATTLTSTLLDTLPATLPPNISPTLSEAPSSVLRDPTMPVPKPVTKPAPKALLV